MTEEASNVVRVAQVVADANPTPDGYKVIVAIELSDLLTDDGKNSILKAIIETCNARLAQKH